jgi:PST family polysaccharide transporter
MKLLKTSFFSGIITLIRIGSGFVVSKIIAVYTGTAGVALLGNFSNFISILLTFANGAINMGVVKYTAEFENDEIQLKKLFSTAFKISFYCSITVGIILLLFAKYFAFLIFHTIDYVNVIRIFGITLFLYALNSLFISILNGKKQIKDYTIVNSLGSIIGLFLTLFFVYFYKIEGALYSLVLSQTLIFFVTSTLIYKSEWFSIKYFNQIFDKKVALKLGHYSLMAIVSALTVPVAQLVLRNLLIEKLGISSAGIWQGMMRISDGYLMILTTSLSTYYLPKLSSLKNESDIRTEIIQGYKIILPFVFISCLIIYFCRFFIIDILFTQEFSKMSHLFIYQLLGDFFKMAAWVLGYLIVAKSMTKLYIISEVLFTISYVFLGYLCITSFGIEGMSIAFALNYFMFLIFMLIVFKKYIFI